MWLRTSRSAFMTAVARVVWSSPHRTTPTSPVRPNCRHAIPHPDLVISFYPSLALPCVEILFLAIPPHAGAVPVGRLFTAAALPPSLTCLARRPCGGGDRRCPPTSLSSRSEGAAAVLTRRPRSTVETWCALCVVDFLLMSTGCHATGWLADEPLSVALFRSSCRSDLCSAAPLSVLDAAVCVW